MSRLGAMKPLANVQLLVVDDDEINRMMLGELLRFQGAKVSFAENGKIALDCVRANAAHFFDAILMDLQMPEMDGFQATRKIKEFSPDIPVIAQSSMCYEEVKPQVTSAGMDAYVKKPWRLTELVDAVVRTTAERVV